MTITHSFAIILAVSALTRCHLPAAILSLEEKLGAQAAITVKFPDASADLSEGEKTSINAEIKQILAKNRIEKIFVIAWSDKDFSLRADFNSGDRDLAEQRARKLRQYLRDSLGLKRIKIFNMAKRANWFERVFDTPNAKVKRILAITGVPPPELADEYYRLHSKANKALILVFSDSKGIVPRH